MSYEETLHWMFDQLPMYQRKGKSAFKKDLTNIHKFCAALDHPEKKTKFIHVAGTNGKGSVCHILASIFQEAGYKTGLYSSPHLKDYRERIRINGEMIPKNRVSHFIQSHHSFLEKQGLSFFEMSVAMAFQYFAEEQPDIAIIETGLGGRLDSTNIITPELSIITNIGFDHTHILGHTLPEIAFEKAGIIKANRPVVIGEKQPLTTSVFQKKAQQTQSPLFYAQDQNQDKYTSDLKGTYQKHNIKTAVKATETLIHQGWSINQAHIADGLNKVKKNTGLQGRWQQLGTSPKIICDTGHNKEGLRYITAQLKEEQFKKLYIVFGVVNDKDLSQILPLLPPEANYYFTCPNVSRGLEAKILAEKAQIHGLQGEVFNKTKAALKAAKADAQPQDLIFIGGSTFTVAEVL